jgi:hypothetical protein
MAAIVWLERLKSGVGRIDRKVYERQVKEMVPVRYQTRSTSQENVCLLVKVAGKLARTRSSPCASPGRGIVAMLRTNCEAPARPEGSMAPLTLSHQRR